VDPVFAVYPFRTFFLFSRRFPRARAREISLPVPLCLHQAISRVDKTMSAPLPSFPVPLEVDGMQAALSTLKGVEVHVESGVVRLALTNYTGVIFLSSSARKETDMPDATSMCGVKRRDLPSQTPDPADALTVKKLKSHSCELDLCPHEGSGSEDADSSGSMCADEELECLKHVYEMIDAAASSELIVNDGPDVERGAFALLGVNGKNPAKTGAVIARASGYDPGMRRPEDLAGGTIFLHYPLGC